MHSAIFAVDMPPGPDPQNWVRYLAVVAPKIERAAVERLAENVWQVDFQKSPAALAHLIAAADQQNLAYRILALAAEPQWIEIAPLAEAGDLTNGQLADSEIAEWQRVQSGAPDSPCPACFRPGSAPRDASRQCAFTAR
jgi:hypothetical protein